MSGAIRAFPSGAIRAAGMSGAIRARLSGAIRTATPPHGCMYSQPSTTLLARRVRPDATGGLAKLGAPHRAGRTRPGLSGQ